MFAVVRVKYMFQYYRLTLCAFFINLPYMYKFN
jgi:hypothetical protein